MLKLNFTGVSKVFYPGHFDDFLSRAWPITYLPDCPDCQNSWWWGRLWMLLICYWNAFSIEGVERRANL